MPIQGKGTLRGFYILRTGRPRSLFLVGLNANSGKRNAARLFYFADGTSAFLIPDWAKCQFKEKERCAAFIFCGRDVRVPTLI
jgi:hypothetical protein